MRLYFSAVLILIFFGYIKAQPNRNIFSASELTLLTGSMLDSSIKNFPVKGHHTLGNVNCNTDFWTVNTLGEIQLWRIANNTIEGGEITLAGAGSGLAYCGNPGAETFYCTNFPDTGISYFNTTTGWITIPTENPLLNNGGFGTDQYCFGLIDNSLKNLYYFDGDNLTLIETLTTDFFTAADIAVDSYGRAWVFRGNSELQTTNLSVYDNNGLISSYQMNFNSHGTYGAFFLNDVLYVGRSLGTGNDADDFIIPITVGGNSASFGTPINFPYENYTDMASCNVGTLSVNANPFSNPSIVVFPNPSTGIFNINSKDEITELTVLSFEGKILKKLDGTQVDLTEFPNQSYILSIKTGSKTYREVIIKK